MSTELEDRVLAYLATVPKAKNRDVATALGVSKREVDAAINELAKVDKIEFLYLGTSFVTLNGKELGHATGGGRAKATRQDVPSEALRDFGGTQLEVDDDGFI